MLQNIAQVLGQLTLSQVSLSLVVVALLFSVYRHPADPLRLVPGPWIARFSGLWLSYHSYVGDESRITHKLHAEYGPIVRLSPNVLDIADGEALWPIYMNKGGFEKTNNYTIFDIDGHASIFSARTLSSRAPRVKSVLSLFSKISIQNSLPTIQRTADEFVLRLKETIDNRDRFDLLHLTRAFALDSVTECIFRRKFGALDSIANPISASPCIDAYISGSKYFNISVYLASKLQDFEAKYLYNRTTNQSIQLVSSYLDMLVEQAPDNYGSYQNRLINRGGASKVEAAGQCMDALVAGTDSTGNNLATAIWFLVRYPKIHERLTEELSSNPDADVTTLAYLTGVIKEALRLSMAASSRLPRVVPDGGWTYSHSSSAHWSSSSSASARPLTVQIPGGTSVGVSAYSLHLNPYVFPNPEEFDPQRWINPSADMNRDWLPFGRGARSCIARNLAMTELAIVVSKVVRANVLTGVNTVRDTIERRDWFLSRIRGDKIELDASRKDSLKL